MRRITVWILAALVVIAVFGPKAGIVWNRTLAEGAEAFAQEETIAVEGTVKDVKFVEEDYCRMVVNAGKAGNILVRVYEAPEDYSVLAGMRIRAVVSPSLPEGADNPGTFDYSKYLASQKIYLIGTCVSSEVAVEGRDRSFFRGFMVNRSAVFRKVFGEKLKAQCGEGAAGIISGMLFGDKTGLADETYESFQKNGTAHILSVSGLHAAIVYGVITGLLGKRRRSRAGIIITAACLGVMVFLASFSVSVVRAVIMIYLKMAADLLHRRYDLISAACVTASFFLVLNPMVIYSTGFVLSFSAVISLGVIGGGLERMVKLDNAAWALFRPIIAIQIGMAPLTAWYFNYFSLAAFISNIPVIFLSGLIIPVGMAAAAMVLLGGFGDALFGPAAEVCRLMSEMLVFFNDFSGAYGRLSFIAERPSLVVTIGFYIAVFLVFSEFTKLHPVNSRSACVYLIVLALVFMGLEAGKTTRAEVVFVDVGQGDCTHIRTEDGRNYLIDGGGSMTSDYDVGLKTLEPYLLNNGVDRLDGVFITHMDADHYKGIASLNEDFVIDNIYLYRGYSENIGEAAALLNLDEKETQVTFLSGGDRVNLGEKIFLDVIWPKKTVALGFEGSGENDSSDFNANSLVMKLNYLGTEILFTGDIGVAEEALIKKETACDIVKVPHHGSRYSSSEDFVKSLGAKAAVIPVGINNFGHPAQSVIERYEESGIMVYRTDLNGAVSIDINSGGYRITARKQVKDEF